MERHRWRAAPALAAACVQMARLLQGSERQSHAAGAAGKQRMQCRILRETLAAVQRRESDSE